ncbi:MAG: hypothetical protein JXR12_05330 [Neptunomonas phycophila]|uniref:hypothetical protein n=1 Tax=Neptunomonas phycophila TaxID=1572645 RepID=UPI003B8BEA8E
MVQFIACIALSLIIVGLLVWKEVIKKTGVAITLVAVIFSATFIGPKLYYAYFSDNTFTAKLVRMETPNEVGRSGPTVHMLYFKDDAGTPYVIQNDDSFLRWKWNSKDYRASEIGKQYTITTQGYRFGLFSIQPNLLDMEVVSNGG